MQPSADINFADPAVIACPYPAYDQLRATAPVYWDQGTNCFVITRYADIRAILLDPLRFSSEGYLAKVTDTVIAERAARLRALYESEGWLPQPALGFIDDPRHKEVRAIFDRAFNASRIRSMDDDLRRIAYTLADRLATTPEADFLDAYAIPLPLEVTALITQIPKDDVARIRTWTDAFIRRFGLMLSEEEERACVRLEIEAQHYLMQIITRLRARPDDSLLSDLVNTPLSDGTTMNDSQLLTHLMADTFVGGSETTTSALASGLRMMLADPALHARLRADPDTHLRTFIEEVLRLESPVQGLYRVARADVTLHGVTIPAGSVVNLRYAAANRDTDQFTDAADIDCTRRNAGSHLAFGSGIHHCVGATLARRELYWGFRALIDTLEGLELAPDNDFALAPSLMLRRLARLGIRHKGLRTA